MDATLERAASGADANRPRPNKIWHQDSNDQDLAKASRSCSPGAFCSQRADGCWHSATPDSPCTE